MTTPFCMAVRRLTVALAGGLALVAGGAHAAAFQGQVVSVYAINNNMLLTLGSGSYDGPAASCGNGGSYVLVWFDPATPYGRTLLSLALSAKLTGRVVYATSTSTTCASHGLEMLQHLDLKG